MSRRTEVFFIVGATGAAAAVCALFARRGEGPVEKPLPSSQNGYFLLLQAAAQMTGNDPTQGSTSPTKEQLRAYTNANAAALKTVRRALRVSCEIPVLSSQQDVKPHFHELAELRNLARMVRAEGRTHEAEGDFDGASQCYLRIVRMGESLRGGVVVDGLVVIVVSAIGRRELLQVLPRLAGNVSLATARELAHLQEDAERPEAVLKREREFSRVVAGVFVPMVARLSGETTSLERKFLWKARISRAALSLCAIEFAAHAFQQQEKRLPQNLEELVPGYLPRLPSDSVSKKPFVYRVVAGSVLVYSVGKNGVDEQGSGDDVIGRDLTRIRDPAYQKAYFEDKGNR